MAAGLLNANGVWIYGEGDPSSPVSTLLNLGQNATSNAIGSAKTRLSSLESRATVLETKVNTTIGTIIQSQGTATQAGTASNDITYASALLTVPAGTWMIQAHANVINTMVADTAVVAVWNNTTGSEVPNSSGPATTTSTNAMTGLSSRLTVVTVATSTVFAVRCKRNGGSAITVTASNCAGTPAAGIDAVRLR